MGTVQSFSTCENCKGVVEGHFDLNSYEEFNFCRHCGASIKTTRTDTGFKENKEIGYGLIVKSIPGERRILFDALTEPLSSEKQEMIVEQFKAEASRLNLEESYITAMINGELELLCGTMPPY